MKTEYTFETKEAYDTKIKNLKDTETFIKEEQYNVREDLEIATKELKKKLESIRKPFLEELEELGVKEDDTRKECNKYEREKMDFVSYQTLKNTKEMTLESFNAWISLLSIIEEETKFKKKLDNGIIVFQAKNWDVNKYFAFKGKNLVGYWIKRIPEHRGDWVESKAWVGEKYLRPRENDLETKEKDRVKYNENDIDWNTRDERARQIKFYRDGRKTDPTYNQFLAYLSDFNGEWVSIDTSDEQNIAELRERY